MDDFDHADITFGKDAAIRCDLLRIVPLSKTETGADDPNNIPPNKQPIDPRIWYENSGRTVLEALVADLNSRGHSKLTLRENGDICIQQGEELVPQDTSPTFRRRSTGPVWWKYLRAMVFLPKQRRRAFRSPGKHHHTKKGVKTQ